jgi:hypothetical protein
VDLDAARTSTACQTFGRTEAMKKSAINERELARILGIDADGLRELARTAQLPWKFTTARGLEIEAHERPAWQVALKRRDA